MSLQALAELRQVMETVTKRRFGELTPDLLLADLSIESLDRVRIIVALEQRYGLELSEEAAANLQTVGDLLSHLPAPAVETPAKAATAS